MPSDFRIGLDTNVLAYAEGAGEPQKHGLSLRLLERLIDHSGVVIPAQCLGELFRVLTAKAARPATLARDAVLAWADGFEIADSTSAAFAAAMDLCADHGLQIWDALVLSVCADCRCRILLSEDMHHGFTWRGVTVVNPYLPEAHPLLRAAVPSL